MRRTAPIREADIQAACIQWLEYTGWCVLRLNSGKAIVEGRCIKLCPEGTPDTVAFKPSGHGQEGIVHMVFIEFKRLGKQPAYAQWMRMQELQVYGARCWVISGLEELQRKIEQL